MTLTSLNQQIQALEKENRVLQKKLARSETQRTQLEANREKQTQQLYNIIQNLENSLQDLRKSQLEQLAQSEKMTMLGNLVAGVAHEINNPISFLLGNVQPAEAYVGDLLGLIDLLLEKIPQSDPEVADEIESIDLDFVREDLPSLLNSMSLGIDRIREISSSLRTFSRADQDFKSLFDLHQGLDSTLLILKHRLKANSQRPDIKVIKDYGKLPLIGCFPGQLNQVFMNLLSNAIDALDEASQDKSFQDNQLIPRQITIATRLLPEKQVTVSIRDNGIGMPDEVKSRIFENLFTTKAVGKGTGLGLAIAQQIIAEKHDGHISVLSELNIGTEFMLTLPVDTDCSLCS